MYVDRSTMSNQLSPVTPARSGSQQGTPSRQTAAFALIDPKEGYFIQAIEGPATGPKEHNPLSAFHPISRPSPSVQVSSSPQVTHSQGMALLETQSTQGMTLCRPTPVHIMDPAVAAVTSATTTPCVQPTNTPVSFASTTQVRLDVPIPPTVNPVAPSTSMGMVPISQNPGVSSMVNTQSTSQPQDCNSDPCRKCGKKNHTMDKCKKKASCKKCKSKEHNTKFCTENPTLDLKCSFCGKTRHTAENCRACKKAEKKARSQESKSARSNMSNLSTTATGQMQGSPASAPSLTRPQMQEQVPSQLVPPLMIGQRLQQLVMSADGVAASPMSTGIPPPAYPGREGMDQNQAYSMAGSTHSIPTSAPGMYDHTNVQEAQSTSSNSSLESHMSQLSRTMLQLAQTNQVIANHQQQNHQAMVDVQKQQTDPFNAIAAATEQRKYDNLFMAIPRYDGSNKEECAIWISRIDQLATSTGRNLQMELLN